MLESAVSTGIPAQWGAEHELRRRELLQVGLELLVTLLR